MTVANADTKVSGFIGGWCALCEQFVKDPCVPGVYKGANSALDAQGTSGAEPRLFETCNKCGGPLSWHEVLQCWYCPACDD